MMRTPTNARFNWDWIGKNRTYQEDERNAAWMYGGISPETGETMNKKKVYPLAFVWPAVIIFVVLFIIPTVISFYFSFTIWDLKEAVWCGFDNYGLFLSDAALSASVWNTVVYAAFTCVLKVVLGFLIAIFLTSNIVTKNFIRSVVFFPTLISSVAVGIMFKAILHPTKGILNGFLSLFGLGGVDWLGNVNLALGSVIAVDVWKGLGIAVVIFIAGIQSIDKSYYESAQIDGASGFKQICYITLPLCRAARNSVFTLAFIGGIRSFELIWAMTKGGPGFTTDVLASTIYKQYASGYYGLSTAGNVMMLLMIICIVFPLQKLMNRGGDNP